jgi:hypothetical protein
MKPPRGRARLTLRETMLRNQASMDLYAALSDKPRVELRVPDAPKPRAPAKPSGNPSEAQVLKAVLQFLKVHPKVAVIYRVNSGTFTERNRDGSTRYVRANTQRGMTDLCGTMKDARSIYIEVKSATGRVQPHQAEFIERVRAAGAVAGVVRSVDDAIELLARA